MAPYVTVWFGMNTQNTLTKSDWISAGFNALSQGGLTAIRVESIAKSLGSTKGSFYWHFKNLDALKAEMLDFWKDRATDAIIQGDAAIPAGQGRLQALNQAASEASAEHSGYVAEPAIRDWARQDTKAEVAVAHVDAIRIKFLEEELQLMGPNAAQKARLFYAAHVGLAELAALGGPSGQEERQLMLELLQSG